MLLYFSEFKIFYYKNKKQNILLEKFKNLKKI